MLLKEISNCFGCGACINVCEHGAISMQTENNTFLYPVINEKKCINCRRCYSVCPAIKEIELKAPLKCVAGISKKSYDVLTSSSGAAFKCIKEVWQDKFKINSYICGVVFDDDFKVKHIVSVPENSEKMQKSKYVQSDVGDVYKQIKKLLRDGSQVLFVGTPCQVSGLKSFLQRDYDNLLCIDLICHGAPSQIMFDKYLQQIEEENGCKVIDYSFKVKEQLDNGTFYTRSVKIVFENGKVIRASRLEDNYLKLFYEKYSNRPSCYSCPYWKKERAGDITIGDAWGVQKIYPELNPFTGVSLMLFNSEKGISFYNSLISKMDIYDCDIDAMIIDNDALDENARENDFLPIKVDLREKTFDEILKILRSK